ncbi:MAG: hypothetical protein HY301_16820 [Verrucomicrobia bacterium]|nr:hypothetical protein [Verrucomicrobiota bacterium]
MIDPQITSMNDETFLRRFESCELSTEEWHHREHLRVAYLYLLRWPHAEALDRMRSGLKALNTAQKVPEALDRGYHETLTQGWMRLVYCALCEFGPAESSDAFLDQQSHLLARLALRFFYSRDRIMSAEAKARFVEPDLTPLPKSARTFLPTTKASL